MEHAIEAEKLKLAKPITITPNDPEVAVNAKSQIENKHDRSTFSSVVNSKQEHKPETVIHQLPTTATEVKSKVNIESNNMKKVVNNIEPTKKLKSKLNNNKKVKIEKFNAGRYIIENFFKQLTMITMETFRVLNTGLNNNLGWGLLPLQLSQSCSD